MGRTSATQLAGLEVGHATGPPMLATLPGLTMPATLPGLEVGHTTGPPMLATLSGLKMLATLSGLMIRRGRPLEVGRLLAAVTGLPARRRSAAERLAVTYWP